LALFALLGAGGWGLARLARLPAAAMLGPMIAMAAASLAGVARAPLPTALLLAAELVLGSGIGAQFSGIGLRELLRGGLIALLSTLYMLALSLVFAWALVPFSGVPFPALFLALAPGGMSGVSLVALALGVEPAFVTFHNVFRVFLILLAGPLVFRWARRSAERLG
ncbi:MAG: AbrB family transcriptional regulator, partial [Burkholderiales bacterium]